LNLAGFYRRRKFHNLDRNEEKKCDLNIGVMNTGWIIDNKPHITTSAGDQQYHGMFYP